MDRSVPRPGSPRGLPVAIGRTIAHFDPIEYSRSSRGRRHAIAIFVAALAIVLAFKIFPLQDVTLVAGDRTVQVRSTFGGEDAALAAAAVELAPGDRLLVGRAGDQAALAVQRATPILLVADGARVEMRTQAKTVAGALALAHVVLGEGDRVYAGGYPTVPGDQLVSIAPGGVPAASTGLALRIKVVRALPATPRTDGSVANPPGPPLPSMLTVGNAGATSSILVDPRAWRARESGLSPDLESLDRAVWALPETRSITVVIGGEPRALRTDALSVEDALAEIEFSLGEYDRLSHDLGEAITEGMEIAVVLVEKLIDEHIDYVPATYYRRDDHTLAPGETRTIAGEPGEVRVWEEVTYEDGVEVAREAHSAVRIKEPVSGEHLRGPVAEDGVSPVVVDDYTGPYREKIRVWATWYDSTHGEQLPGHPAYGITYSGIPLEYGICAVDPDYIPLHTRFYVPGYGECLAADIGGLINGYDVDLGYPDGHAPDPWHTGYVHIYILD